MLFILQIIYLITYSFSISIVVRLKKIKYFSRYFTSHGLLMPLWYLWHRIALITALVYWYISERATCGWVDSILGWSSISCLFDPVSIGNFHSELYLVSANTHNAHTHPYTPTYKYELFWQYKNSVVTFYY